MGAAALLLLAGCGARPNSLRIAAAADLRFALDDVVQQYTRLHGDLKIAPVYGSSGLFYAQLLNHAPFDMFLSADLQFPRKLADQGLTVPGSEFTYATGRLVIWSANPALDLAHRGLEVLTGPEVRHVAIANPSHAPYGRAAEAALRSTGLYDRVKGKLVMGENITQAFQMVQSGAADAGLVALSLAIAPGAGGQYAEVPAGAYPRIQQGGAILKWSAHVPAARQFREFLISPEGRAILKRYGFSGE